MTRYIGIDPGPIPGVVVLVVNDQRLTSVDVIQCSAPIAPMIVKGLLPGFTPVHVQTERFVVGRKSQRSGRAGTTTIDLVGNLEQIVLSATEAPERVWIVRAAANVKPWATDARLDAAGLLEACKGMRHARDAARHALFAAVHDGGIPDPLSKEWNR